jgi:subtilisin
MLNRLIALRPLATLVLSALVLTVVTPAEAAVTVPTVGDSFQRVIVLYKDSVTENDVRSLGGLGGILQHRFSSLRGVSLVLPRAQIRTLQKNARVLSVLEDMPVQAMLDDSVPLINANLAHQQGVTGVGVRVCVVDSGVDDSHPSLPVLTAQHDFVNADNDAFDDNGHGTHVAGIIASQHATNRGVSPGVMLMAAKVLDQRGSGFASDVIAGIEWCVQNGADVINMSLGGGLFTGACDTETLAQAANLAVDQGTTVVAASGNNGSANRLVSPACGSKVIAVGAVDKNNSLASYSNGGSELDITAPGTSINSTFPGADFTALSGTSMASPHAAGVAALVASVNTTLTPDQIRTILQTTALDLGPVGFDTSFGHGRIDALAAIAAAGNGGGNPPPPPPPPLPSTTIFTDALSNFSNWNVGAGWTVEVPAERTVPGMVGGNTVAHADSCSGANGCTLSLKTALDLTIFSTITLKFWRYVDNSLDNGEFLRVDAWNGNTWQTLRTWSNGSGDDDTWREEQIDLTPFKNSAFSLRFVSKENSTLEEAEVDFIRIETTIIGNQAPNAAAGADQTLQDIDGNGLVTTTLNAAGSSDDTGITFYEWKEGATVLGNTSLLTRDFTIGAHTLMLTVRDSEGLEDTDTVVVTVIANQPPVANAGSDIVASDHDGNGTQEVTLNGSLSSDPDGSVVSHQWSISGVPLGNSGATLTHLFPVGTTIVELTVTDNGGATANDTVSVTIGTNTPPTANAGPNLSAIDHDGDGSALVRLDGSLSQDDGVIQSMSFSEGSTHLGTGALIDVPLFIGQHTITLTVWDSTGQQGTDTVLVTVLANTPPVAEAGPDQTITVAPGVLQSPVTLNGSLSTDPNGGAIVSYEWKEGATVLATTVSPLLTLPLGTHTLTLTVTDAAGAFSSDDVTITIQAQVVSAFLWTDDFSGNLSKWSQSGDMRWSVTAPEQIVPGHAGGNSVAHADWCRNSCTLTVTTPLNLSLHSQGTVSFWRFVDQSLDSGEFLRVEVFNGTSWQILANWTDGSGDDDAWHFETFDISAYLSPAFSLRFVTRENSLLIEKVEVDDVRIEALP